MVVVVDAGSSNERRTSFGTSLRVLPLHDATRATIMPLCEIPLPSTASLSLSLLSPLPVPSEYI